MYIFELIAKIFKDKKTKKVETAPLQEETDYEEKCSHIFLPIDSTGETLACSKCGLVVKNRAQKVLPKNPFVD